MPYALFLASCSMGSPIFLIVLDLMFPSASASLHALHQLIDYPLGSVASFYLGYSAIGIWDSLSTYAHPGIACLASQVSNWLGAFWASLSGLQSSVTLVKLLVIGHFL